MALLLSLDTDTSMLVHDNPATCHHEVLGQLAGVAHSTWHGLLDIDVSIHRAHTGPRSNIQIALCSSLDRVPAKLMRALFLCVCACVNGDHSMIVWTEPSLSASHWWTIVTHSRNFGAGIFIGPSELRESSLSPPPPPSLSLPPFPRLSLSLPLPLP